MSNEIDSIKIGTIDFAVKAVDGLRAADGTWLHGEINWHTFEIRTAGGHTHESRFVTLWHEVIHGLEELYGFRLKEREVIALGNGIAQILRDNPVMNWAIYDSEQAKPTSEQMGRNQHS